MPTPISAVERLRRERQERAIEELLFRYPGLIDRSLNNPHRQVFLAKDSRADLLFYLGNRRILVEIKRDAIRPAAVTQIQRYAGLLEVKLNRVKGYLVGTEITPAAEKLLQKSPFPILFKKLGTDIPTKIKVCRQCRSAYSAGLPNCPYDGNNLVI